MYMGGRSNCSPTPRENMKDARSVLLERSLGPTHMYMSSPPAMLPNKDCEFMELSEAPLAQSDWGVEGVKADPGDMSGPSSFAVAVSSADTSSSEMPLGKNSRGVRP